MSRNLMSSACDEEAKKMVAYGDELHGKVLCDEERKKKRQKQWGGRKFTPWRLLWCSFHSAPLSGAVTRLNRSLLPTQDWNGWANQSRGRSDQHQTDSPNDRPEGNNRAEGNRALLPRGVDAGTAG